MQPREFWALSLWEWWAELDAKVEASEKMDEMLAQAKGGGQGKGGFSKSQWDDARRRFSEQKAARR